MKHEDLNRSIESKVREIQNMTGKFKFSEEEVIDFGAKWYKTRIKREQLPELLQFFIEEYEDDKSFNKNLSYVIRDHIVDPKKAKKKVKLMVITNRYFKKTGLMKSLLKKEKDTLKSISTPGPRQVNTAIKEFCKSTKTWREYPKTDDVQSFAISLDNSTDDTINNERDFHNKPLTSFDKKLVAHIQSANKVYIITDTKGSDQNIEQTLELVKKYKKSHQLISIA